MPRAAVEPSASRMARALVVAAVALTASLSATRGERSTRIKVADSVVVVNPSISSSSLPSSRRCAAGVRRAVGGSLPGASCSLLGTSLSSRYSSTNSGAWVSALSLVAV